MKNQPWNVLRFKGTASWNSIVLAATAVLDNGVTPYWPHSVRLTTNAVHGLTAGSAITIALTTNYNGTFKILERPTTSTLIIESAFIAEDTTTNGTCMFTLAPKHAFEWGGFRLELNAAVTTAANLTVTMDAGAGDVYDTQLYKKAMATVQYIDYNITDAPKPFGKLDELDFGWANADGVTYGLEVLWRRV